MPNNEIKLPWELHEKNFIIDRHGDPVRSAEQKRYCIHAVRSYPVVAAKLYLLEALYRKQNPGVPMGDAYKELSGVTGSEEAVAQMQALYGTLTPDPHNPTGKGEKAPQEGDAEGTEASTTHVAVQPEIFEFKGEGRY